MRSFLGAITAKTETKTPVPMVSRAQGGLFGAWLGNRGATQALSAMEAASVVFGIVDRLATAVSLVDWKLWKPAKSGKPEDRTEVTSHLALDILNRPNDFMTRQELFESGQQHQELTGESWLVVGRNPRAKSIPLELWVVRPDRMEPVPSAEAFLKGYVYRSPDGEQVPLGRDDVLFVKRPDPNNPYRGLGPIRSTLTDIDSIRFSMEWNKNFFVNGAEPGGIVEIDRRLSDDEFDELVARWKEQHQGTSNAHRVAILEQVKWVDRKYTMRDMQFTELRGVTERGVMLAFGFPKFALGDVDDVNRAQGEASIAMFAKWLVVPRLERWKGVLNRRFLPLFGSTASGLEFDYVSPVSEDSEAENAARTSKSQAVSTLAPLGFDPTDLMDKFGLPEVKWSKPEPPAPPAGPAGRVPPSDEVMAHAQRTLLGKAFRNHPGGPGHVQESHGRRGVFGQLSMEAAQKMQDAMLAGETWTDEQKAALAEYSDRSYFMVNNLLFDPDGSDGWAPEQREYATAIAREMHAAMRPLPQAVQVHRLVDTKSLGLGLSDLDQLGTLVGAVRQNGGFTSTSVNAGTTGKISKPVRVVIDVPAGTPAAYIESVTSNPGEGELILDAGAKLAFDSLDAERGEDGRPVLRARVVP